MTHSGCRSILIGILTVSIFSFASGCASVNLTAANSVNPVLLGPVRAVGGKPVPDYTHEGRDKNGRLSDDYRSFYDGLYHNAQAVSSISSSTLNSGYYTNSFSSMRADDPAKTDIQVLTTTEGDVNRVIYIHSIDSNGVFFYLLLAFYEKLECSVYGISPKK